MADIRYCENCKYCKQVKGHYNYWLECTQFNIEVVEDDYCSFGDDIEDDYDKWRDEPYELYKEARLERREHEDN